MAAWIVEHADGTLTQHDARPGTAGIATGKRWAEMPRLLAADDTESWNWTSKAIVVDLAKLDALLTGWIKVEGERRKMVHLTPGGAKKTEYAEKRAEVIEWDMLGPTPGLILSAFQALTPTARAARFAHALADSAAFGDAPAAAIERFRAGLNRAAPVPAISAVEAKACAAIRAATTAAAKRAAYAAIIWS